MLLLATFLFSDELTKNLLYLSYKIRGEQQECSSNAIIDSKNYYSIIDLGINNPLEYEKQFPSKSNYELILSQNREYFRFWSVRSISNFMLFNEFNDEYLKLIPKLAKYYETNFKFSEERSFYFATHLVNDFLNLAVGSYESPYKLSNLEKMCSDPKINEYEFESSIYSIKPSKRSITNMLNIALLYNQSNSILQLLLNMGASINNGDESAIFFALKNIKNVEFLIKNGADVNYENSFGKTPLFYALEFNDVKLIKYLIKNGANVNKRYIDKAQKDAIASGIKNIPFYQNLCALEHTSRTVFMHASAHSNPEILKILISNGANIHAVDDLGYNALDYAINSNNIENIKFLKILKLTSSLKGNI